jgi:HK97 gp10 family phage protein
MTYTLPDTRFYIQLENLQNINAVEATLPAAKLLRDEAKRIVPVDTGALRSTIMADELPPEEKGSFVAAGGDCVGFLHTDHVGYAMFVEFGTSNPNYPIQPYMRPAIDGMQRAMAQSMASEVNKQLAELAK